MRSKVTNFLAVISICLLGILVYSNAFYSPFQFDDAENITGNVSIRNLRDLKTIWNYWPPRFMTYLSLSLNYHFNQLRVPGYHLVNLIIHLTSAILVRWLILLTFSTPAMKDKEIARHAKAIAFLGSLIFVAHPVQTGAVTYIIQRTATLAALFYVASLSLYVKARLLQRQKLHSAVPGFYYVSSFAVALLGMFTKEVVITLPLMILLYEFCFLRDRSAPASPLMPRRSSIAMSAKKNMDWKYIVPFLIILLVIPVTVISSKSARLGALTKLAEGSIGISRGHYFLTQFRVVLTYLRLLFIPLNQNLDYDYPVSRTLWELPTLASGFLLVLILTAGILLFSRYRLISFSIFWFFLTLSPESSVLPLLNVIFEHRLYLPLVAYSIFLPTIVYYLCRKKPRSGAIILLIIIASYSTLTYARNDVWRSTFALWNDTVSKSPGKARPYLNRAAVYGRLGLYEEAISDCNRALSIQPDHVNAYINRGLAYHKRGEHDKAISDFNEALRIDPDYAKTYNNRGLAYLKKGEFHNAIPDFKRALSIHPDYEDAYNNLGFAYLIREEYDRAILNFSEALRINPNHAGPHYNRGIVYLRRAQLDKAILDFSEALKINPTDAEAYTNRGIAYMRRGELDKAISNFDEALRIKPNCAKTYYNRGICYDERGEYDKAISDFNRALGINPAYAKAYKSRGTVHRRKGEFDRAIRDFNRAITINPNYADAYNNRGVAYAKMGKHNKAISDFDKALRIDPDHADAYENRKAAYERIKMR